VLLTVSDNGAGMDGSLEGGGITGMRERALLVDANLEVGRSADGGVRIGLDVPSVNGGAAA
jgi:two-component system, NarL family, sensor histidine kinase UhpB